MTAAGHPGGVRGGLALALGKLESRDDGLVVDDESAVGGVDHIGQTRYRIDDVDAMTQAQIGLTERLPLRDGATRVDRR